MEKYKKYYGVMIFAAAILVLLFVVYQLVFPKYTENKNLKAEIETKQQNLQSLRNKTDVIQQKIKKIRESILSSQKKIYSPIESDLGNDTLFFTLYNDVIEMLRANSVKINSIDYTYNPETDEFVKFGKDVYFVCDVNISGVSNYINLGKFIQDIYQYPYYIRINNLEVKPYPKDKKILLSKISLRLYAHTAPTNIEDMEDLPAPALSDASTPLPQ